MNYQTYAPHADLSALVKFYWTLEVPFDPKNEKQMIIPDGCIEMTFNFADPIKKYISEDAFVIQPQSMVMGQRTKSFYIQPLGNVDSFAICFYPYGFANFVNAPLESLVDIEVPIEELFGEIQAMNLEEAISGAENTLDRIKIIEAFLFNHLSEESLAENLVKSTVDTLLTVNGNASIKQILKSDLSKRRQLERNFKKQIGISPKQLGRVLRLQTALKLMLNDHENLTHIAYESDYFDQAHFIKDFKEFIGTTPKDFLRNENMALSALFYR